MDIKVLASTFGLIFLAELGDKTQLAALTLSAETGSPLAVFLGASLALICVTFLGVFLGHGLTRLIPAYMIQLGAGVLFIGIGGWLVWKTASNL